MIQKTKELDLVRVGAKATHYRYYANGGKIKNPSDLRMIVKNFLGYVQDEIVAGHSASIPYLGHFNVIGRKPKHPFIDWGRTTKMWEKNPMFKKERRFVYYLNEHTDGYAFYIRWMKEGVFLRDKEKMVIRFSQGLKARLSQSINEDYKKFERR